MAVGCRLCLSIDKRCISTKGGAAVCLGWQTQTQWSMNWCKAKFCKVAGLVERLLVADS